MGFFSDVTGGIFGGETSAERGARKAADELRIGGEQAIETTRAAAAPFAALGTGAGSELSAFLGLPSQPFALSGQDQSRLDELIAQRDKLSGASGGSGGFSGLVGKAVSGARLTAINAEIAS